MQSFCFILFQAEAPSITDWISSIAAIIGVPLALWSFVKLIVRDKNKESQLESLKQIAQTQNSINIQLQEQVAQLTKHTSEFQYQSTMMFESNQLLEKQVNVFSDYFTQTQATDKARLDFEKQKRLLEIRPHFFQYGSSSSMDNFELPLINRGGTAQNLHLETINADLVSFNNLDSQLIVDKDNTVRIYGRASPDAIGFNGNTTSYEVNLHFEDIDGNSFFRTFAGIIINMPSGILYRNLSLLHVVSS